MSNPFKSIPDFIEQSQRYVEDGMHRVRMNTTRANRILRRLSNAEAADILGCDRSHLYGLLKHPDAPEGEVRGREKTLSVADVMKVRAMAAARPSSRTISLPWRSPGDPLPVVTFNSLKGGTGKSSSSAHFAQFCAIYYGLRVGVIDADPQSTCSLYFVDDAVGIIDPDVDTFTSFMGLPEDGSLRRRIKHNDLRLNSFWQPTPWPGIRLIPGGASIQVADIALYMMTQSEVPEDKQIFRMLRDAITAWDKAYPPKTAPEDLMLSDGSFDNDAYERALTECVDIVVIDTAPSLSLAQVNAVMAADTLIVPQTMKGFDLSTLHTYLGSLEEYLYFQNKLANPIKFKPNGSMVLPTLVNTQNDVDVKTIGELYTLNQDFISPVYYRSNDAAANAFMKFQSAYEFVPDKGTRAGIKSVIANANAVSEHILHRVIPNMQVRGFANAFIDEKYPDGVVPRWTESKSEPVRVKVKGTKAKEIAA
ncbi:ParA family protein [Loktanella sp. DJP18]|uniref:ParA family protein n=1 Tax=Loktanella sp. DJP18 TaxID=3409788 RepID=UPI003BB6AF86